VAEKPQAKTQMLLYAVQLVGPQWLLGDSNSTEPTTCTTCQAGVPSRTPQEPAAFKAWNHLQHSPPLSSSGKERATIPPIQ